MKKRRGIIPVLKHVPVILALITFLCSQLLCFGCAYCLHIMDLDSRFPKALTVEPTMTQAPIHNVALLVYYSPLDFYTELTSDATHYRRLSGIQVPRVLYIWTLGWVLPPPGALLEADPDWKAISQSETLDSEWFKSSMSAIGWHVTLEDGNKWLDTKVAKIALSLRDRYDTLAIIRISGLPGKPTFALQRGQTFEVISPGTPGKFRIEGGLFATRDCARIVRFACTQITGETDIERYMQLKDRVAADVFTRISREHIQRPPQMRSEITGKRSIERENE